MTTGEGTSRSRRRPATTPEEREHRLINLSYDAAEEQIKEGRATSQLLVHFLRLGTEQASLEKERLRGENALLEARVDSLASAKRIEELYSEAMKAFSSYQGHEEVVPPDDQELHPA